MNRYKVKAYLMNETWNGGEFRQIEKEIEAKTKTSALNKFMKTHRKKLEGFDYFSVEIKKIETHLCYTKVQIPNAVSNLTE